MRRSSLRFVLVGAAACFVAAAAQAAEAPSALVRTELAYEAPARAVAGTVSNRPRPDFDADGLPLGAFRAYPKLAVSAAYDSNLFRTEDNVRSDFLTRVQPSVRVESDWSRHRVLLVSSADLGVHRRHSSENYTDASLEAAGTIDIHGSLRLESAAGIARLHESRGSVDGDGGSEPVTFFRWHGQAALAGEAGRFGFLIGADHVRLDYEDVPAVGGGVLNQDDRDRRVFGGFGRVSYAALPDSEVFVAGRYDLADFDAPTDDSGANRDSQSQSVVAGLEMDWGGITFGQVYAGWFAEQFDDDALDGASGFTAGGAISANVTPLTTLTLRGSRELRATVTSGASSLIQTEAAAGVDHELLRNLLLGASVRGRRLSFEGIDRTDDHLAAGIAADWLLGRHVQLAFRYDFEMRNSHGLVSVNDWHRHTAAVRLLLQR